MSQKQTDKWYNVFYYDDKLGLEDFTTVKSESEDGAVQRFEENRYDINEVELAYRIDQSNIDEVSDYEN